MRSARQALTDIAALCVAGPETVSKAVVRVILADVEPEPAVVWDRDAARDVLRSFPLSEPEGKFLLDALEGCVRSAPQQTIDRGELVAAIKQGLRDPNGRGETGDLYGAIADRVLALLRPVEVRWAVG